MTVMFFQKQNKPQQNRIQQTQENNPLVVFSNMVSQLPRLKTTTSQLANQPKMMSQVANQTNMTSQLPHPPNMTSHVHPAIKTVSPIKSHASVRKSQIPTTTDMTSLNSSSQ